MKKLFTLFAAMLIAMATSAQSPLDFCYGDGTVIKPGSRVIANTPNPETMDVEYEFNSDVHVKNNTDSDINASMVVEVKSITGNLSVCLGLLCRNYDSPRTQEIKDVKLKAGSINDTKCHWVPAYNDDGIQEEGSCLATMQLYADGVLYSEIEVLFYYGEAPEDTGITDIKDNAASSRTYNLQGQAIKPSAAKGIYIRNGRKYVAKP